MTDEKQPNEVASNRTPEKPTLPNAISDPKLMMRLRKNRHMSGLMCPPMGVVSPDEFATNTMADDRSSSK